METEKDDCAEAEAAAVRCLERMEVGFKAVLKIEQENNSQ